MGPLRVVKGQVSTDRCAGFADCGVGMEVNLLVLHRPPQPLHDDIVAPGAPAVHADSDFLPVQHAGKGHARELAYASGEDRGY